MTIDRDLTYRSARELARLTRIKELSPVEVVDAHLDAAGRCNPAINAVVTVTAESARFEARRVDRALLRGEDVGPLGGVPAGIKDVTPTAGIAPHGVRRCMRIMCRSRMPKWSRASGGPGRSWSARPTRRSLPAAPTP